MLNSEGIYYEINESFGMNEYYNNDGKHAGKGIPRDARTLTSAGKIGKSGDETKKDPDSTPANPKPDIKFREIRKKQLKGYFKEVVNKIAERKKLLNLFKNLVSE
jgi:hypothetical protein